MGPLQQRSDMPVSSEIVVVGAGSVGANVAYRLAQRGARVTVLDAGAPGGGTSSSSFAWLNAFRKTPRDYYDLNVASMAEHAMAMMLMLSRHLKYFVSEQQRAHWADAEQTAPELVDLEGKTILVVGLGGIGTEVAKRAHAFGMRVIATRASGRTGPEYVSYVGLPNELLKINRSA